MRRLLELHTDLLDNVERELRSSATQQSGAPSESRLG
jgi:hypothetical protein